MKITSITYSDNLNRGKYAALMTQAKLLAPIRSNVWQSYGSIDGLRKRDRQIRDQWLVEDREFAVPANAWKETLRDAVDNIRAYREAAQEKVKRAVRKRTADEEQRKRMYMELKSGNWTADSFLRRKMRKFYRHGVNHTRNQIIVRADQYTVFMLNGRLWLKIPSLEKGRRVAIPLRSSSPPKGTLRVILRRGRVEIHFQEEVVMNKDCGDKTLGIDKGFTEVFMDSNGKTYGEGFGKLISSESDYLKAKHQKRNKLRAIGKNKPKKAAAIEANNLGRKKLTKRQEIKKAILRTQVFSATHRLVKQASCIVAEDLTAPMASNKTYGKNQNRRLTAWCKRTTAEALKSVSQRRGSSLHHINPAYTSQMDSRNGLLLGERRGEKFYCFDGVVLQADMNAARNVLARHYDPEIDRWTPHQKVKSILLKRTESQRLKLFNLDSSYTPGNGSLTESELPMSMFVHA